MPLKHSSRSHFFYLFLVPFFTLWMLIAPILVFQPLFAQSAQTDKLFQWELQTIYLTNLERRKAGLPPLRWNSELTESARWFARDAVESNARGFCGHTDSLQRGPGQRMREYGFTSLSAWAENAVCGYTTPEAAVKSWMNSAAHKANILNPMLREIGVGYYLNDQTRGYIVQDMAVDGRYAPVIIDNEAISTTTSQVTLYIYDQSTGGDFGGVGPTTEIMVANNPIFEGAAWEPYAAEKSWTLTPGDGWKTVYVKTRDRLGRTTTIEDSIYLGAVPAGALDLKYASAFASGFEVETLDATGYALLGLSLNWLLDDGDPNFELVYGAGASVSDPNGIGGTAYRMHGADRNTIVMTFGDSYFRGLASVAYFRLKVSSNSAASEALRLIVSDGETEIASRSLKGTDFAKTGEYQEFAVPFTLPGAGENLLAFQVNRIGAVEAFFDVVSVYTAPAPWSLPLKWSSPDGYYRSSGIQGRLSNPNGAFSAPVELNMKQPPVAATPAQPQLQVSPQSIVMEVASPDTVPAAVVISVVCTDCSAPTWEVSSNVNWLNWTVDGNNVALTVDPSGLETGVYFGEVVVTVTSPEGVPPQKIQVSLVVGDPTIVLSHHVFMPVAMR